MLRGSLAQITTEQKHGVLHLSPARFSFFLSFLSFSPRSEVGRRPFSRECVRAHLRPTRPSKPSCRPSSPPPLCFWCPVADGWGPTVRPSLYSSRRVSRASFMAVGRYRPVFPLLRLQTSPSTAVKLPLHFPAIIQSLPLLNPPPS
jgi:hypothetical protein